jgi:hypothetical protein
MPKFIVLLLPLRLALSSQALDLFLQLANHHAVLSSLCVSLVKLLLQPEAVLLGFLRYLLQILCLADLLL